MKQRHLLTSLQASGLDMILTARQCMLGRNLSQMSKSISMTAFPLCSWSSKLKTGSTSFFGPVANYTVCRLKHNSIQIQVRKHFMNKPLSQNTANTGYWIFLRIPSNHGLSDFYFFSCITLLFIPHIAY